MVLAFSQMPNEDTFPEDTVAHEAVVPLVVRYFPELPVWDGRASTVAHEVLVPFVVRNLPLLLV